MPLNCSIFVTQKEQLKCQAARGKSIENQDKDIEKSEVKKFQSDPNDQ